MQFSPFLHHLSPLVKLSTATRSPWWWTTGVSMQLSLCHFNKTETLTLEWISRHSPGKQKRERCYEQLQTLENQSEQQTLMDFACQTSSALAFSVILHTMYVSLVYYKIQVCSCKASKQQRTMVLDWHQLYIFTFIYWSMAYIKCKILQVKVAEVY